MAKHSVQRKRKKRGNGFSFGSAVVLVLCFIGVSFGLYLWQAAFSIGQPTPTVDDDDFRPTIGEKKQKNGKVLCGSGCRTWRLRSGGKGSGAGERDDRCHSGVFERLAGA